VDEPVLERLALYRRPVDLDLVALGIGGFPERRAPAVDRYTAGLDQSLASAP